MTLSTTMLIALVLLQEPATQQPPEGLQASDKEVEVEAVTEDASIERRLRQILDSTGRFEEVEIEVTHGVALLSGMVSSEAESTWVAELVSNTEGVVAVSSELGIEEAPIWDLGIALRELEDLWRKFVASLPRLLAGLVIMVLVALFATRASKAISGPIVRKLSSELLRTVIEKLIVIAVWLAGIYIFLRVSGLTQIAVTVVGGTGVLGLVLGFAFRDIAENFLASVLISLQRPFRYGDTIEVDGHLGVVQRVTPRGTILMDFEGNYIQIANAQVYKSTIKNFTANPNVRQDFVVGVGYDAGVAHAQEVAMGIIAGHSAVLEDPKPMVLVEELASATVNLRIYFWVNGAKHSKVKVRSALMRMILRALEEEGVSMPDDAREVIFPDGVPVRMLEGEERALTTAGDDPTVERDAVRREADRHDESTEAEGGLESETEELNEQARRSRSPEEGEDVLAG